MTSELTLNNPLTEEQWDMITDVDFDRTDHITFHTKHGKEVEFTKVIRCKDCRYYDARAKTMDTLCTRKQGCRETIPEGFCGWAIPKMDEVEHETD